MIHLIYIYLIINSFLLGRLYHEIETWGGGSYLENIAAGLIIALFGVPLYIIQKAIIGIKRRLNK